MQQECDSYLIQHEEGWNNFTNKQTRINKKEIIKMQSTTVHHGDYLPPYNPEAQHCRNVVNASLGRSCILLSGEEMDLDEMLPKR